MTRAEQLELAPLCVKVFLLLVSGSIACRQFQLLRPMIHHYGRPKQAIIWIMAGMAATAYTLAVWLPLTYLLLGPASAITILVFWVALAASASLFLLSLGVRWATCPLRVSLIAPRGARSQSSQLIYAPTRRVESLVDVVDYVTWRYLPVRGWPLSVITWLVMTLIALFAPGVVVMYLVIRCLERYEQWRIRRVFGR